MLATGLGFLLQYPQNTLVSNTLTLPCYFLQWDKGSETFLLWMWPAYFPHGQVLGTAEQLLNCKWWSLWFCWYYCYGAERADFYLSDFVFYCGMEGSSAVLRKICSAFISTNFLFRETQSTLQKLQRRRLVIKNCICVWCGRAMLHVLIQEQGIV